MTHFCNLRLTFQGSLLPFPSHACYFKIFHQNAYNSFKEVEIHSLSAEFSLESSKRKVKMKLNKVITYVIYICEHVYFLIVFISRNKK